VGGGGASRALDRGWEAAEAAVDGKPGLRRGSDEVGCSGKGKTVQMWLRECKRECIGSSRTRFKSRRRHGERELVLANRRRAWQLGAMAARHGGARRGPARGGEQRRGY
jgi:hypothetical protein